ncbi:conserved hypothetical protein [Methanocaldococcus vulcanius M7]|uniref:Uncharacterized protein n=1 Tax=Methanocaldococcus vulcanius (strain ATCC 700851 / DSM 12094 / M7) TaxID=579137 RepID=C9RFJ1_METVM|nr:hypothetical protein [Methanocaldococcus vulcanius]ACX72343.1 conserved hypothetical protein [Methanocaldococcus vulcanius M7]
MSKAKNYIYFFAIACLIALAYTISINAIQMSVIPAILVFLFIFALEVSSINKRIAHNLEKIEVLFMLAVLVFFAYALYKLYIVIPT